MRSLLKWTQVIKATKRHVRQQFNTFSPLTAFEQITRTSTDRGRPGQYKYNDWFGDQCYHWSWGTRETWWMKWWEMSIVSFLTNTATRHEHGTQHVFGWETTALINTIWILPCFDPNVQAVMATVATLMLLFLPLVMVVYRSQSLTLVYGHFYLPCLVLRNPLTYLVVTSRGSGHRRKIHPLVTLFCEQNCHWVQKCCKKYVPSL